jgi:hypothetical protein
MRNKTPNISALIDGLFPDHIVASYPRLIEFAKVFFEYLDKENKASYYQNSISYQRDIREQDTEFLEYIQRELGILSQSKFAADPKVFYDNISQIWKSKGSEESIKTFFRLFLNDEVEIFYPWESVLIPSDGRWIVDTVLRVSALNGNPEDFVGKRIFQVASDAQAVVNKVERKIYSDGIIYELQLIPSTIAGTFVQNKTIYVDENLTAEVYRSVNGLIIENPGSGYKVGDKITLAGYEGMTFTAFVSSVDSNGGILGTTLTDFGSGNTPLSVIATNTSSQYFLIDFIFYEYPAPENLYQLITETPIGAFVDYGLIAEAAILAQDYGTLTPPDLIINIQSEFGSGAIITISYGALATYQGYYQGVKGQLSESIVLQDSKYYQKFSYEVKTSISSNQWIQPLKKFAHPSGMEVIGNVFTFEKFNVGIKDYFVFVRTQDPVSYTFIESPGLSDTILGYTQDYVEPIYFAEDYIGILAFSNTNVIPPQPTQEILDDISEPQDL